VFEKPLHSSAIPTPAIYVYTFSPRCTRENYDKELGMMKSAGTGIISGVVVIETTPRTAHITEKTLVI
jgi:hypothetical protein